MLCGVGYLPIVQMVSCETDISGNKLIQTSDSKNGTRLTQIDQSEALIWKFDKLKKKWLENFEFLLNFYHFAVIKLECY